MDVTVGEAMCSRATKTASSECLRRRRPKWWSGFSVVETENDVRATVRAGVEPLQAYRRFGKFSGMGRWGTSAVARPSTKTGAAP